MEELHSYRCSLRIKHGAFACLFESRIGLCAYAVDGLECISRDDVVEPTTHQDISVTGVPANMLVCDATKSSLCHIDLLPIRLSLGVSVVMASVDSGRGNSEKERN